MTIKGLQAPTGWDWGDLPEGIEMGWGVRDARRVQRKRVGVREFFVSK
jgi:hypothetical protein